MGGKLKLRKASLTLVMHLKLDFSSTVTRVTLEWLYEAFFQKGHFLTENTTHLLGIQYEYLLFTNSYQLLDFKRSCPYCFF